MNNFKKTLIASSVLACMSSTTYAQLEEVVVTATKRESSVQDLPFSINAQSQKDIQRTGAFSLEDLSRNVAGLSVQNLGPGQSQVAIRGVSAGQIVRDQPGVKEQVGVYLDESVISLSLFTPDLDLYDLNRVETLRGPQGTLFGSGSIGGTIRYITNKPVLDEFEGSFEGNINTVTDGDEGGHLKGAINIPINDKMALRAVGYATEYAGYIDALGENGSRKEDVNSGSRQGGRLALLIEPNDRLSITPRIVYQEVEADGFNRQEVFNLFANPYTTTRPAIQLREREQYLLLDESFEDETIIADIVVNYDLDGIGLTYAGSYTDREIEVSRDASALTGSVSIDLGLSDDAVLLPSNLIDTTDIEQVTHEFRVASNHDGALQWVGGVFYSDVEREYDQRLPTPGYDAAFDAVNGEGASAAAANGFPADSPFNSDLPYDLEQTAVFAEASWDISEAFNLTVGTRYYDYEEERDIKTGGVFASGGPLQTDETSSDGFTSRILASYDVSDNTTLNAQVSEGFRLGGVNDPLNQGLCEPADLVTFGGFQSYDDETLTNYEVGVKSRIGDTVSFSASVFYADIEDLQVTLDAGSCSSRISFNVPEAHTQGVEWELSAFPVENLLLTFNGSYVESEFDSTVVDATGAILGGVEDGNRLASVPELQLSAAGTYTFPISAFNAKEAYITAVFQYVDERFTQPGDQVEGAGTFQSGLPFGGATGNEITEVDVELDAYEQINLSMGMVWETWEAVLYANNITDENADLSFDRERGGRARLGFRTNQPRTVGITVRKFF